jgi:hypothetical protein
MAKLISESYVEFLNEKKTLVDLENELKEVQDKLTKMYYSDQINIIDKKTHAKLSRDREKKIEVLKQKIRTFNDNQTYLVAFTVPSEHINYFIFNKVFKKLFDKNKAIEYTSEFGGRELTLILKMKNLLTAEKMYTLIEKKLSEYESKSHIYIATGLRLINAETKEIVKDENSQLGYFFITDLKNNKINIK